MYKVTDVSAPALRLTSSYNALLYFLSDYVKKAVWFLLCEALLD